MRGECESKCVQGGEAKGNLDEGVDGLEVKVVGGFIQEEQVRSQQTQVREYNARLLACVISDSVLIRPKDALDGWHWRSDGVQSSTLTARQIS